MKEVAKENLYQLHDLLRKISKQNYIKKLDVLSESSIGEHIRHILEFYLMLVSGAKSGTISYDKRKRDLHIETDTEYAMNVISQILLFLGTLGNENPLMLSVDFSIKGEPENNIKSSVGRELAYCIEHSIHHQALIKAGLYVIDLKDLTDEHFGVAYSTIRYRNTLCAQ